VTEGFKGNLSRGFGFHQNRLIVLASERYKFHR